MNFTLTQILLTITIVVFFPLYCILFYNLVIKLISIIENAIIRRIEKRQAEKKCRQLEKEFMEQDKFDNIVDYLHHKRVNDYISTKKRP